MDFLEQTRKTFSNDKFATQAAGIVIDEVSENYCRCSMEILPIHINAANAVMGGALFTLADFSFAVASNSSGELIVSLTSQITYLNAAINCKTLYSEAKCIKFGKTTCSFVTDITDDSGKHIATVSTTGCRTGRKL